MTQDQPPAAKQLIDSPAFKQAAAFIRSDYDRFVKELIALTEIPAPPFKEERRARAYLELLRQAGLSDAEVGLYIRRGLTLLSRLSWWTP